MNSQNQVLFFLGAGASVPAGVPDTYGIVIEFIKHVKQWPDKHRTITRIIQILEKKRKELGLDERVDVELLLETLERLGKREQELVLWFYELGKYLLKDASEKTPLEDDLKEFIKQKAIVNANEIKYLEPFVAFIEEYRPIDVFSANYDTCIEQFCDAYQKDLHDGFDIYWNPEGFKKDIDIRLYKLHGSVTWYRSDRGNYLKIPILSEGSSVTLTSGEKAESLILFPIRKWEYAEPMLELLVSLKQRLETASYVFVIGYSFRDDHIRRIFWDAARNNKRLIIFLVGPKAAEIYDRMIRYYEETPASRGWMIPSSLDGKVITLPYKFEDIFPLLKNYYLNNLRMGQIEEKMQQDAEVKGQPSNWAIALKHFVDCEFVSKVMQLLGKVELNNLDWALQVEVSFKMLMHMITIGNVSLTEAWSAKFVGATTWLSPDRLMTDVIASPQKIDIKFVLSQSSYLRANAILSAIEKLADFADWKSRFVVEKSTRELIEKASEGLCSLKSYLSSWGTNGMDYQVYLNSRRQCHSERMKALDEAYMKFISPIGVRYDDDLHKLCQDLVREIEQEEFSKAYNQLKKCIQSITD